LALVCLVNSKFVGIYHITSHVLSEYVLFTTWAEVPLSDLSFHKGAPTRETDGTPDGSSSQSVHLSPSRRHP
jgi:hypothetical protein